MKVAIIGAGHSGLLAARHIANYFLEFDIYERRKSIGGVWRDREQLPENKDNLSEEDFIAISPMYDTLSTNGPVSGMGLEDLEYPDFGQNQFIHWENVNKYLKTYAEKFGLMQHILLQTEVTKISRKNNEWMVRSCHLPSGKITETSYGGIIVCNGHEEIPFIPSIEGTSTFKGSQIHSKIFRHPNEFRNQNVLIIGVGPSGSDIAMQLTETAKTIYLSHHREHLLRAVFPANIIQKPDVKKFAQDSAIFVDDSTVNIDAVIYCTGYKYNISFLDETCGVTLGDKYIKNLYKQMISIEQPSLIFCGLHRLFFVIPLIEFQAKVAAKILAGLVTLPTKEKMQEDTSVWEEKCRQKGKKESQFFAIENDARSYTADLARIASVPPPQEALFEMFEVFYDKCGTEPAFFKKHFYKIDNGTFIFKHFKEL